MGKKKKKSQKKKKSDSGPSGLPGLSFVDTLGEAKKNETTLQTLLRGVSEQGFVHPKKEEEEKITPQLSHESRTQMAAEYLNEDVLLTQRDTKKKKPRTRLVQQVQKEPKPSKKKSTSKKTAKKVVPPISSKKKTKTKTKKQSEELTKPVVPPPAQKTSEDLTKPVLSILLIAF